MRGKNAKMKAQLQHNTNAAQIIFAETITYQKMILSSRKYIKQNIYICVSITQITAPKYFVNRFNKFQHLKSSPANNIN